MLLALVDLSTNLGIYLGSMHVQLECPAQHSSQLIMTLLPDDSLLGGEM